MDVYKNRGTPKWMVKIMENSIEMDDLGVFPYFWKHPYTLKSFEVITYLLMASFIGRVIP